MGQAYVDVAAAQAEMGIMTMAASGGGQETGGAWLFWTDNGFTDRSWYWEDPNNGVTAGWAAAVEKDNGYVNGCNGQEGTGHDDSYEDFIYHVSQRHSENLNYILGDWKTQTKTTFIVSHPELTDSGCVEWQ